MQGGNAGANNEAVAFWQHGNVDAFDVNGFGAKIGEGAVASIDDEHGRLNVAEDGWIVDAAVFKHELSNATKVAERRQ